LNRIQTGFEIERLFRNKPPEGGRFRFGKTFLGPPTRWRSEGFAME